MKTWFNLLRWPNLLLILIAHLLFRYSFLDGLGLKFQLSTHHFFLLSLSIILITAAGNVINDIFDIKIDFINKRKRPLAFGKIKISKAYSVYIILNILALISCFYISYSLNRWFLFVMEIGVVFLLYGYAKYFKAIPVLGNILVSGLVSLSFVLVLYFDMSSGHFFEPQYFSWILFYSGFAFWTNLNREWIKDLSDLKGDYAQGISTLPILLGKSRMNMLIFGSTLFLIISLVIGVKIYFETDLVFILCFIFGICVPLILVLYHFYKKELNANYKWLSHLYKFVMFIGICSLILFSL